MPRQITMLVPVLWAVFAAPLYAQEPAAQSQPQELSPQQKLERLTDLERKVMELFTAKQYEEAADACRRQIELVPNSAGPHYNLACALARLDKVDDALAALGKALLLGYADAGHMQEDPDLAGLRGDKRFASLVDKARANYEEARKKIPYEAGQDIDGVKTVEDDPPGGLRFRVRMSPTATKEKPQRLIVWLHPSGGSMNRQIETLATRFIERGYALLVLTQKQFLYWSPDEARRLTEVTLPAAGRIEGLDAARPILFGYSAGGQMALQLWHEKPAAFGGLMLVAAYPVDAEAYARGRVAVMKLPADEAYKRVPILAFVGEKDGGAKFWKSAAPVWQTEGLPLVLKTVADKGHTWLISRAEWSAVDDWLKDVAAGKAPNDPVPQVPAEETPPKEPQAVPGVPDEAKPKLESPAPPKITL